MSNVKRMLFAAVIECTTYSQVLLCAVFLLLAGNAALAAEDMEGGADDSVGETAQPTTPAKLDLPANFVPSEQDFIEKETGVDSNGVAQLRFHVVIKKGGNFMGIARLRGRPIKARNGLHPIYLSSIPKGFKDDPFLIGDLILGVEGKPLTDDPTSDFKKAVEKARKQGGKLTFERWRKGKIETVTFTIPDRNVLLTQGGEYDPSQEDWNLGTTGAEGWILAGNETTDGSKEIYVTQIEPGSPADGVLTVGDVILGANGNVFTNDARKEFSHALTESETTEKAGKLVLSVWKAGKTREATLTIKVMGNYSATSLTSAKTGKIIDEACRHLKAKGLDEGLRGHIDALGLMATGREDVMPLVRKHAQAVAAAGKDLQFRQAKESWAWGYANLFLTEYYLATKDETVLPAIREYSTKIAMGQSRGGAWGHAMCVPYMFSDGPVYGICPGYGELNQAGLICMISLALAPKCGINNDEITLAIKRGSEFFKFFAGKGAVPYGDHAPEIDTHEDNGKSSETAVLFDLLGDEETATFFTKMTIASYNERENGHTGNYFNLLWGPLGAARGGDAAAAAFMKRMEWFFDLERRRQGNFIYQGKAGVNKEDKEHQYKGWDCTGARLLAYCLPLKKIYLTGKGRTVKDITGQELAETIAAGEPTKEKYSTLSTSELLARLQSWSPAVRQRAGMALENKPEDVVPQLIALLDSDNRYARYGACQGLRFAGRQSEAAVDAIIAKGLRSGDPLLRYFAMYAFTSYNETMGLSKVAKRAVPELLEMAAIQDPADPRGRAQQELAVVLFYSGNANPLKSVFRNGEGIEKANRDQLVGAVRRLLKVSNGGSRSCVASIYDKLTEEELRLLWKDIYQAVREQAPSGIMFSSGVREGGLELMAKWHTKEGLETAAWYLTNQKFHSIEARTENVLKLIVGQYGGYAKAVIPVLEKAAEFYEKGKSELPAQIRAAIKAIETAKTPEWKMTSIAEYLK